MHQHDRRSDLVEQLHHRLVGEGDRFRKCDLRQEAADDLVRGGVFDLAGAGPLRMEMRLRPKLVLALLQIALLRAFGVGEARRAVDFRHVGGTAAARLVHHIDRVAAAGEILRPAFAAIGRAGPVGSRARAAVHEDDRIGMRLLRRDAVFNIHLPGDEGLAVDLDGLAADIEEAVAREIERRIALRFRRHGGDSKRGEQHRGADREQDKGFVFHCCILPVDLILGGHPAAVMPAAAGDICPALPYPTIGVYGMPALKHP